MDKIETALIMPVLNCLNYTQQFLLNLSNKTKFKTILINNGSTDGTKDYFNFIKHDFNTKIFNLSDNIGVAGAWNFGINHALKAMNCRYFFIVNNDTLLHPDTIDILLSVIKDPKILLASATDVSGQVSQATDVLNMMIPGRQSLTECPDFSCYMVKRETIEKIGWFDEKFYPAYFEDNDYHNRINLAGFKGIKSNQALYYHYGSRTMKGDEKVKAKCNIGYSINRDYYKIKWGGEPGKEIFKTPFNK